MIQFSVRNAFVPETEFYPYILGDITQDPTGKFLSQLNSYVYVCFYAYDPTFTHGTGDYITGSLGSSKPGTTQISDDYLTVGIGTSLDNGHSKNTILKYLKKCSDRAPQKIISFKDFPDIPVVVQTGIKNATYYGLELKKRSFSDEVAIKTKMASNYQPKDIYNFMPKNPLPSQCYHADFSTIEGLPNQRMPTEMTSGSFAVKVVPEAKSSLQTIIHMYGDSKNYMGIYYTSQGNMQYRVVKDGIDYVNLQIGPVAGKSFNKKEVIMTLEAVKTADRKYAKNLLEEAAIFRVKVPSDGFEMSVQQPILFNWKHEVGEITPVDSANARGFAYIGFSDFVAGMKYVSYGGSGDDCSNLFTGTIYQLEIADKLPQGASDFWNNPIPISRSIGNSYSTASEDEINSAPTVLIYSTQVPEKLLHVAINSSNENIANIEIFDITGKKVRTFISKMNLGNNCFLFNVSDLLSGVYVVKVILDTGIVSKKIIL